ncbi:glycosyltransferase [Flavobacterium sp.]|uniref:glycosyltransferase n=1 Tax=Flavobacterium sp. TaxID=239 RepID=UPI00374D764D
MISIIICSRENNISTSLKDNIASTIGFEYELVIIDNSKNQYSIFEAYNIGIGKSYGEILCFIHDDIKIITENWGEILNTILKQNEKIGLIGIAGSKSKTKMPSAWWDSPAQDIFINIIQHSLNKEKEHWFRGFTNNPLEEVVAIDGVFMAARKVESINFSEELKGFHNYDLNFSFEYLKKGYKIVVTKEVLLEHYSRGIINKDWCKSAIEFYKLYKDFLPLSVSETNNIKSQEFKNGNYFVSQLIGFNLIKESFRFWLDLIWMKPKSKSHFQLLKKIIKQSKVFKVYKNTNQTDSNK